MVMFTFRKRTIFWDKIKRKVRHIKWDRGSIYLLKTIPKPSNPTNHSFNFIVI